jgi:hypothetical protein
MLSLLKPYVLLLESCFAYAKFEVLKAVTMNDAYVCLLTPFILVDI